MSYRNYRLADTTQYLTARMHDDMLYWKRAVKNIIGEQMRYDGENSIQVLTWLNSLCAVFDSCHVPEGAAWIIAEQYLKEEARAEYTANMDRAKNDDGGFNTWAGAVNRRLQCHVTNDVLAEAAEAVEHAEMGDYEDVMKYHKRLRQDARALLGSYNT